MWNYAIDFYSLTDAFQISFKVVNSAFKVPNSTNHRLESNLHLSLNKLLNKVIFISFFRKRLVTIYYKINNHLKYFNERKAWFSLKSIFIHQFHAAVEKYLYYV